MNETSTIRVTLDTRSELKAWQVELGLLHSRPVSMDETIAYLMNNATKPKRRRR